MAALGLHFALANPADKELRLFSILWQLALGALIGCGVGAMLRAKR